MEFFYNILLLCYIALKKNSTYTISDLFTVSNHVASAVSFSAQCEEKTQLPLLWAKLSAFQLL